MSYTPVRLRLARAIEQAVSVQNALSPFTDSNAHKLVADKNADGTEHYVRVHFEPEIDLLRVGILFGEFVHQLRCVLDNLAWQLVLCSGDTPGKSTEFPIFKNLATFRNDAPRKMRGMKPTICAEIEGYQPFTVRGNSPKSTALWLIHDLDIVDKHRIIVPVVVGAERGNVSGRVENGAIFFTIFPPEPMTEVKVQARATFSVAIKHGDTMYRIGDLMGKLTNQVDGMVENFSKFIERPR